MDFITHLPLSKDHFDVAHTVLCVIVDRLTKMLLLVPMGQSITPSVVAQVLTTHVYAKHGKVDSIVSDRDPCFTSGTYTELCKALKVRQMLSTAFHRQTNGQTKRVNRVVEDCLRHFVDA